MDKQYEQYCMVDPLFYDSPASLSSGSPGSNQSGNLNFEFEVTRRPLPQGWTRVLLDEWLLCSSPDGSRLPLQGWKIHVSACLDNAEDVLRRVWEICVARQTSFKFLPGRHILHARNAKYAPRGASGKLATIYPVDEVECELLLKELDAHLRGEPGPYILSDLRWGDGPLYVRYGGFAKRYCEDEQGRLVAAVEDADGHLVPDRRRPIFQVPPWVTLPEFLAPHLAARNSMTIADLPYSVEKALHFSNGGGVYVAEDTRTGEKVVLKEARLHAGLDADGADAVTRLDRERAMLQRLEGLGVTPSIRDYFTVGDHHFLAQEFIDGKALNTFYAERYPLLDPEPDPKKVKEYTAWALRVYEKVERAVTSIHERGVIFNDLHMFNILVRPDDRIALIDFEVAAHVSEDRRPTVGNQGFLAPRDRTGFDIDRYSLACLRLALFMPMTTLFWLDRSKAERLAEVIVDQFPVTHEFLDPMVQEITRGKDGEVLGAAPAFQRSMWALEQLASDRTTWDQVRESLTSALVSSATPHREDRLFPGDVEQFNSGGLGFGYGAAGVLYALSVTTGRRYPQYEEWLLARARHPGTHARLGLYDGLHGVAYVFQHLGYDDQALELVEFFLAEKWERLSVELHSGLSGAGMNLARLGAQTGEAALRNAALRTVDIVADRLGRQTFESASTSEKRRAGLLHGPSGAALLFIRLWEQTGDSNLLDLAAKALRQDLQRCVHDRNDALQVDEGWRTMPYLGTGSVGIGMVLDEYLRYREDDQFEAASRAIRRAALSPFYAQSGLMNGRAGMILYLARRRRLGLDLDDRDLMTQVRNLSWHALSYQDHLAFPGDQLYRMSMDLATGTAGVLLALGAAMHNPCTTDHGAAHLPFLGSVGPSTATPHPTGGAAPQVPVSATSNGSGGRR